MEKTQLRGSFTNRLGFVLAAAGSAVGLGNIWRFPYLAAKYGGGSFLLVYIIFIITIGFSLLVAEIAMGRKTRVSAIGAYKELNPKFSFIGAITALVPIIILPYYSVIGGWVIKYITVFFTGQGAMAADSSFFTNFISKPGEPVIYLLIYIALTFIVVLMGVQKGVEKACRILMPLLVAFTLVTTVYTLTLPGAGEGVLYYITPDVSRFSGEGFLAALGQMFYSLSLAMGISITYGSYMKRDNNITKSARQVAFFDLAIAFLAGLMIVPAVFAFSGGDANAVNAGPGLMFQTLPKVFNSMGIGDIVGAIFFILVLFAAWTSSIALMETVVSILQDKLGWGRKKATVVTGLGAVLLALPSTLGYSLLSGVTPFGMTLLDFFDFLSNSVMMPIVAFLTCIFVGYIIKTKTLADEVKLSSKFREEKMFNLVIKYIGPVCILAILISSVLNAFGIISL